MPSSSGAHPAAVLAHTTRGYERLAVEQALRDAELSRPSLVRRVVARLARRRAGASAAPVAVPVAVDRTGLTPPEPAVRPLGAPVHAHPSAHLLVEQTRSAELQRLSRAHADARAARRAARSARTVRLLRRWPSAAQPLPSG